MNLGLKCSFANAFMVSDSHLPGSLDGGGHLCCSLKDLSLPFSTSHKSEYLTNLSLLSIQCRKQMAIQSPDSA